MATPRMICNSSYVLISIPSCTRLRTGNHSRSTGCPGKYIILSRWGGSGDGEAGAVWRVFYLTEKLMLSDPAEICKIRGSVESATLSGSSKAKSPVLEDNGLIVESIIELLYPKSCVCVN